MVSEWSFSVKQDIEAAHQKAVREIYRSADILPSDRAHFSIILLKKGTKNYQVIAERSANDVITALEEFRVAFPHVVDNRTVRAVTTYEKELRREPSLCTDCKKLRLRVECVMEAPWHCSIAISATLTSL